MPTFLFFQSLPFQSMIIGGTKFSRIAQTRIRGSDDHTPTVEVSIPDVP